MEMLSTSIDPLSLAGLAAIFSYSFLLSFHCIGMCGPLACSMRGRREEKFWTASLLYNAGRGLSYTIAGAAISFSTQSFGELLPRFSPVLALLLGGAIIVFALLKIFDRPFGFFQAKVPMRTTGLRKVFAKVSPTEHPFVFGLLTLFLPCMTLHPTLLMSAAAQDAWHGAMTMFAFFLGTLPAMLSATCVPSLGSRLLTKQKLKQAANFILLFAGLLTIWRSFHGM